MSGTPAPKDESAQNVTLARFLTEVSPRPNVRVPQGTSTAKKLSKYYDREVPLAEATVIPDRPVAMYGTAEFTEKGQTPTDPDWQLLFGDLDAKKRPAEQVAQDAAVLEAYFGAVGVPYVSVISGPSMGRHLWIAVPAGIPGTLVRRFANAAARICPTFDKNPLENLSGFGCLRPPGSPHRDGGRAELDGIDLDEAIARLKVGATREQIEQLVEWMEEEVALLPEPERQANRNPGDLPPSVLQHGEERVRAVEFDDAGHLKLAGEIRALDERARKALETPLEAAADHSHRLFPALRGLVRARFTCEEAWQLAQSELHPGLAYLASERQCGSRRTPRPEAAARRILDRQWMFAAEVEARRPVGDTDADPAPEVTAAVAALWIHLGSLGPARWSQQSGPSDMAAALFVGLQMLAAARLDVSLGTRRMANAVAWCHETCNQALNRLRDRDRVLVELDTDPKHHNRRVMLSPEIPAAPGPESSTDRPISHQNTGLTQARNGRGVLGDHRGVALSRPGLAAHGSRVLTLLASDLFAHGGAVGHHGGRTWLAMENAQGLLSLSYLIQETGYGERTVRRHMAAFSDAGLVTGDPLSGWTRTDKPLEEAAKECETAGTREARAARYEIDQMAWNWWRGEVWWMKLPNKQKRHHPRVPAQQCVLRVGQHPAQGRRFPRRVCGAPDHSEAARLLLEDLGRA